MIDIKTELEQIRILLVDDDVSILRLAAAVLAARGYSTYSAQNGQQAIALVQDQGHPGLIVTDYHMPDMNGLEVIKAIRALTNKNLPAAVMTGDFSLAITNALDNQRIALLHKPFEHHELYQIVDEALA